MSPSTTVNPGLLRQTPARSATKTKTRPNFAAPLLVPRQGPVRKVIEKLLTDLRQPHYLAHLAAVANLCPKQLIRLFQQQTGLTPLQYLKRLRLKEAKDLLADGTLSIQEVLQQVGYENASQFSADFKLAFGCTPRQQRQLALSQP